MTRNGNTPEHRFIDQVRRCLEFLENSERRFCLVFIHDGVHAFHNTQRDLPTRALRFPQSQFQFSEMILPIILDGLKQAKFWNNSPHRCRWSHKVQSLKTREKQ